ncbi:transmembrane protein 177 [Carettochelys insculpta]|uniref:transmembrane protein 177 n=1 Tax=Carettochelys insculpta TaxID=44489 RepID=UPI003EBCD604
MAVPFLWKAAAWVQKHRTGLLVGSCAGLFGVNLSYHVFPEQTFRLCYQCWTKGQPAELSEKLHSLFHDVLKDVGVNSVNCYQPFAAFGFHPVSAGIPWLPAGCLVGIPANFNSTAEDRQGIVNRVIVINGREVDWESKEGLTLKEALMFSPEAQKFAIAREIVYLQSNIPVVYAAVPPACLAGTCLSGVAIKQLLGLYSGPMLFRGIYNMTIAVVGVVGYFLAYDAVSHALDYRSDRKAATISKDYATGGVEFYNKILSRNQTLRALLGKQGEKIYAPSGNLLPRYGFRLKHTPYTSRRDSIIKILRVPQAQEGRDRM